MSNFTTHLLVGGDEVVTSPFGYRTQPYKSHHNGVDVINNKGKDVGVLAYESGVVKAIRTRYTSQTTDGSAGNYVRIDHGGYETVYYHLAYKSIIVSVGQKVEKGQRIATMGNTGHSTGTHLHFGVQIGDVWQDPMPYLCKDMQSNNSEEIEIVWHGNYDPQIELLMEWLNKTENAQIKADGICGNRTYNKVKKHKVCDRTDGWLALWVQNRLKQMGLYNGKIDGEPRSLTVKSIKTFEKLNGLTVNGEVFDVDWYYLLSYRKE